MVLGANWQLANAKCSMVHENNPDAVCMYEIERRERAVYRQLLRQCT